MLNGIVHNFYSTSCEKTSRRVEDDKINLREIQGSEKFLCNSAKRVVGSPMREKM